MKYVPPDRAPVGCADAAVASPLPITWTLFPKNPIDTF